MDCCERSERARTLAAELKAIMEWDSGDDRPAKDLERYELDGRVAREMRRAEIVMKLNTLRLACKSRPATREVAVSDCGVKEFFGEDVCRLLILGFIDSRGA